MAVVLGIDQSLTSTGIVILDSQMADITTRTPLTVPRVVRSETIKTSEMRGTTRLAYIQGVLKGLLSPSHCIKAAAMEGYAYGVNMGSKVFELGELGGVVKLACLEASTPLTVVNPSHVKKFACGRGNKVGKDDVRLGVYKSWGFEHPSNDVIDAYVIALVCLALAGKYEPQYVYQREVLESIRASMAEAEASEVKRLAPKATTKRRSKAG